MGKRIVGIGACVFDTLYNVPSYPSEDTKMRATGSKCAGGGPTATGLVAASKLGESAAYIGVLSSDSGGVFLKKDFEKYGIDTSLIDVFDGYRSFASVLWLSADTASRTCVFDRGDLPPLVLSEAQKRALEEAFLLMVDGNEMSAAVEAARVAKESGVKVLYDCGGLYEGVDRLLSLTDIMIPSEEFAMGHTGTKTAEEAAKRLFELYSPEVVVVTQGKLGGIMYDGSTLIHYPAFSVKAVDTNGSGDVFHGAFAAGMAKGFDFKKCCLFASAVSAIKCTSVGARESVPDFDTVVKFMRENGYEL
ncbi:MAG: bifunctional hydroxymethylpyrimidine kinase/phosphomethylpyrimidine kinase [Clostridia bacterium]|nr:bifunctional hydroxymethylpyrimidine kinase/phosphomethylpyrimidine kinase [Clostridia bacterium]